MADGIIQALDLGTGYIKGMIGTPGRDGSLRITAVRAVPVFEDLVDLVGYLRALERMLPALATGFLDQSSPVHLVAGEQLVRSTLVTRNGQGTGSSEKLIRTSYERFVHGQGTRVRTVGSTLDRSSDSGSAPHRVCLLHGYMRQPDIEALVYVFSKAGLRIGSVVSSLVALVKLAEPWLQTSAGRPQPVQGALLEIGRSTTRILHFRDGDLAGFDHLYQGTLDIQTALVEALPSLGLLEPGRLHTLLSRSGWDGDPENARELGVTGRDLDLYRLTMDRVTAMIVRNIGRTVLECLEAESGGLEASTRRLDGDWWGLLTGGLASSPGFLGRIRQELGGGCRIIDPVGPILAEGAGDPGLPLPAFGPVAGTILAIRDERERDINVGGDYLSVVRRVEDSTGRWHQLDRKVVLLGLAAFLLSFLCLGAFRQILTGELDALDRQIEAVSKSLPPKDGSFLAEFKRYREQRLRDVLERTRAAYASKVVRGENRWEDLLLGIQAATPPGTLLVNSIEYSRPWPGDRISGILSTLRGEAFRSKDASSPDTNPYDSVLAFEKDLSAKTPGKPQVKLEIQASSPEVVNFMITVRFPVED